MALGPQLLKYGKRKKENGSNGRLHSRDHVGKGESGRAEENKAPDGQTTSSIRIDTMKGPQLMRNLHTHTKGKAALGPSLPQYSKRK